MRSSIPADKPVSTYEPTPAHASSAQGRASKLLLVDNRPVAVARRQQQAAIASSARQLAQRQPLPVRNATGLPDELKTGIEHLSGHSLDDVRVHYNSARPAQLQALAYAQGAAIHLAPGQAHHLPHEAWHVVQQKQGRVRPTLQVASTPVNDNAHLEREADVMGQRAVAQGKRPAAKPSQATAQRQASTAVAQLTKWEWDGNRWNSIGSSSSDTDSNPHPNEFDFDHPPQLGDHYDQQTGEHIRRQQDARDRLRRSSLRQANRSSGEDFTKRGHDTGNLSFQNISKGRGNRIEDETPFGTMRHGRGPFQPQPFGTFAPEDWELTGDESEDKSTSGKGKRKRIEKKQPKNILTNYDEISTILGGSKQQTAILEESGRHLASNGPVQSTTLKLSRRERQAATALNSLLSVAESNQSRNPTGSKVERAAIRRASEVGVRQVFNRKDGEYVPSHAVKGGASMGGTGAFREMRRGDRPLPLGTLNLLDHLSDSSGEETQSSEEEYMDSSEQEVTTNSSDERQEDSEGSDSEKKRPTKKRKKSEDSESEDG